MNGVVDVTLGGVSLRLLAPCGIHWPQQDALLVADTHFGKEASFRRGSIPVPRGVTAGTLRELSRMLDQTRASQLVVLGDMFHDDSSLSADVQQSLDAFFQTHWRLRVLLTRGNHDARVAGLPCRWPIEVVPQYQLDRVVLAHHPASVPEGVDLRMCGHLHPAISVGGASDHLGALPCYWLSGKQLVLPAIGQFTGTHRITPGRKDRVWVVAGSKIIERRIRRETRSV